MAAASAQNGDDGAVIVTNSTITGNSATSDGAGIGICGGYLVLGSSIVAGNTAPTAPDVEVFGAPYTLGNNLIQGTTGTALPPFGPGVNADQIGVNPALSGGLQNNGGPTQTIALAADSPARGTGRCDWNGAIDDWNVRLKVWPPTLRLLVTTDQRGVDRGKPCAVGAFEAPVLNTSSGSAPVFPQAPMVPRCGALNGSPQPYIRASVPDARPPSTASAPAVQTRRIRRHRPDSDPCGRNLRPDRHAADYIGHEVQHPGLPGGARGAAVPGRELGAGQKRSLVELPSYFQNGFTCANVAQR